MTDARDFNNLLAWSMQTGVLVAIAGLVAAVFRLRAPKARLLYWQLTLAACLLLPFIRAWKQESVVLTNAIFAPESTIPNAASALSIPARSLSLETMLVYLLALVSIARLAWLMAGLVRMRGYRRRSTPLAPQRQWGVEAQLLLSPDVTSPVTFGFVNPVILLPADFTQMDETHREAILCHEFQHIRRHDWLFTLAEELIRTALWFHPAIWWILSEVQLAREQAVDEEAIGITRSRDKYVDALLAIASAAAQPDLAAASPFLRRRHLKRRIVSIFEETRMSRTKAVSVLAASLVLLAASCWLVTGAIPLYGAPQVVADSPGVTVDTGGAALMHRSAVVYPADAVTKRVEGTVTALVKLDAKGNVTDASVVSGPDELRKAVLQSVLNWHFTSDTANSTRQIAVSFRLPAESAPQSTPAEVSATAVLRAARVERAGQLLAGPQTGTLATIAIGGLGSQQEAELSGLLPVHVGDAYNPDVLNKVISIVHSYDEHLRVLSGRLSPTEFALQITAPDVPSPGYFEPAPPPPPLVSTSGVQPQRIGGAVMQSQLVSQEAPVYPPLAKAARVQGAVRFEALIGTDGRVQNLQVTAGPPLLVKAAIEAVKQWTYKPTLLNGNPVEVITTVDVNFTLADQ